MNTPLSYNLWAYGYDNPVRYSDPSGFCPDDDGDGKCDFPSKQVSKTCSVLYGKDRLACEAIVYGVNPDKGLSIPEIHALVIKSECGNGNLGDYFSSPRAPQSFDRDARQYGIWFHWLANTIPGWWNNERTKDVQIQQLVAVAFGREATATYYTLPDEKYFFERAFAVKMWHPDYSFYMYMGGREVVLDAVTLTLFGQPCPAKEHPNGCPPTDPVNSSEFTNQMGDASQYGIGTIPFESAYDILHDPDLREYSPSAPWDFGNPTDATPQKVKDVINRMDIGTGENQLIHITDDRKAFFVTLPQQIYLCNNKSCV